MNQLFKKKFVPSSKIVSTGKPNTLSNAEFGTNASDEYKKIIFTSKKIENSKKVHNDKIHSKKTKEDIFKFKCNSCGWVRSKSIYAHNLSIEHQLKADEFSKNIESFANYKHIDPNNRGYWLLKKEGWNGNSGLGKKEQGRKYPIKAKKNEDRQGIGFEKPKLQQTIKVRSRTEQIKHKHREKLIEISFRREFYEDDIIG